jgi:hypothetical protein
MSFLTTRANDLEGTALVWARIDEITEEDDLTTWVLIDAVTEIVAQLFEEGLQRQRVAVNIANDVVVH